MPLNVYRTTLGDCTANGVSSKFDTIYIPCEEGFMMSDKVNQEQILYPEKRGENYWCVKPLTTPANCVGPMAGGNLAYSSDSRIKHVYHIHDRFETQQTYDTLSR